jgi:hypothetical protein
MQQHYMRPFLLTKVVKNNSGFCATEQNVFLPAAIYRPHPDVKASYSVSATVTLQKY